MEQLALRVTTLSPLSMRSDYSPNGADVAPYIYGSTLLGCLASAHRLLRKNDTEFTDLFLSDKVKYPNLYPASFKNKDVRDAFTPVYCIPRTAQTCKRFKGFHSLLDDSVDDEDEPHGVRDNLFDWALFALLDKSDQPTTDEEREQIIASLETDANKKCSFNSCGEPLDSYAGFYRWAEGTARAIASPDTRLLTRTGINRKYGTVEESILYNRKVYEEESIFFGIIQADDDVAEALRDFILDKGNDEDGPLLLTDFARLGTARTRGFGQVEFEPGPPEDIQDRFALFKDRLLIFDEALRERAGTAAQHKFYIALTLHAPVILYDKLLRYEGTISGERLGALLGLTQEENPFELLYHSASMRRMMGWQELWGLPRAHEYAIDAGSVFLFALTKPLDEPLVQALFVLEEQGIGQRRAEGFGRICISDPFHREGNLQ